jgi:hypothetical protein
MGIKLRQEGIQRSRLHLGFQQQVHQLILKLSTIPSTIQICQDLILLTLKKGKSSSI